jgi:hypothetical protein
MNIQNHGSFVSSRFGRGGVRAQAHRGEYLTHEQLERIAPTIFKAERHSSRSEKFEVIPTFQLLDGLEKEGFYPVKVQVGGSKDVEKRGFTKHLLRLRRRDDLTGAPKVGDSFPEIVIVNAHDGTASYQIHAGLFRLVCANGLTVSDDNWGSVKVGHTGRDVLGKVIEGTYTVLDNAVQALEQAAELRAIPLTAGEERVFGEAALRLRYDDESLPNITGDSVVRPRRGADYVGQDGRPNLWLTYNKAQENLVKGGLFYRHVNDDSRRITDRRTRPVQSADGDLKLNRALWHLAKEFAALKGRELAA